MLEGILTLVWVVRAVRCVTLSCAVDHHIMYFEY